MKVKLSDLSVEQKIKLLAGKDCWHTEDLDGLLYCVRVSDGPLGVRYCAPDENDNMHDLPSVAYPSATVLAQTWDADLAYRTGEALADDCIERNVDVLLAPGVNIKRTPMCGRNFEYFSEDPYVAGTFAERYIEGIQDHHVGTSLKHYCCNNLEVGRLWTSSEVDERTLREIYVRAFEIALKADPWCVMSSYNAVNGVRMSQNGKMNSLLRNALWKRNGTIISDWDAVKDHTAAVKTGLDIEMPYSLKGYENLKLAFEEGRITEEEIDACVERVLAFIEKAERESKLRKVSTTVEQRLSCAERVAEEGVVLLKNNGVLPISNGKSVAIGCEHIGEYFSGGGSSRVVPTQKPDYLDKTLAKALPDSKITIHASWSVGDEQFLESVNSALNADVAIVIAGFYDTEGDDRADRMRLNDNQERLILRTAEQNPNTVVILHCGSVIDMSEWIDKVAAVIYAGYAGERGHHALANILSGKVNPSGKLTETYALSRYLYPSENTFANHMVNRYSEGLDVGYRYFDRHPEEIAFPFGFGLSYSTFEMSNLNVTENLEKEQWIVSVDVKNASDTEGAEVVQVYVSEPQAAVYRPVKELKGFKKVRLSAGQTKTVKITLDKQSFAYYSVIFDDWTVNGGTFEIKVGNSSRNVLLTKRINIQAKQPLSISSSQSEKSKETKENARRRS